MSMTDVVRLLTGQAVAKIETLDGAVVVGLVLDNGVRIDAGGGEDAQGGYAFLRVIDADGVDLL